MSNFLNYIIKVVMNSKKKKTSGLIEISMSESNCTFFYKQSIFNPCPENCLSFSKKLPQKLFSNCLVDGLLTSIV